MEKTIQSLLSNALQSQFLVRTKTIKAAIWPRNNCGRFAHCKLIKPVQRAPCIVMMLRTSSARRPSTLTVIQRSHNARKIKMLEGSPVSRSVEACSRGK